MQFQNHRAAELERSKALRARLAELKDEGAGVRQQLALTRVETAEERQKLREQQACDRVCVCVCVRACVCVCVCAFARAKSLGGEVATEPLSWLLLLLHW